MLNSNCSGQSKGFVFTLDVLIAFMVLVSFFMIANPVYLSPHSSLTNMQLKQLSTDVFLVLDENGFFLEVLDSNATSAQKMTDLQTKFNELAPHVQTRVELKSYDLNVDTCRLNKTFDQCFENEDVFPAQGPSVPIDKDVVHEKRILIKKIPPGVCQIQSAGLEPWEKKFSSIGFNEPDQPLVLNFAEKKYDIIYFDVNDINIDLNVTIVPDVNEINCDDNMTVNLSATIPPQMRLPIDMMLVLDKSGSMEHLDRCG